MELYKKSLMIITVLFVSGFSGYASYMIYNFYNPVARATLGLIVIYLLFKVFQAPIKVIKWWQLEYSFEISSFLKTIATVFFYFYSHWIGFIFCI